ncbi:MAG: endopeptidase La [Spirochaetes bacterium]|nr:endopeptidase La [Spirochaetota bacterium]MBU0956598.1 endopeptidase La [Spirochaetota bacterium]
MSILENLRPRHDTKELPLVYVHDVVVFPNALSPVLAATKFCTAAADLALAADKLIILGLLKQSPADSNTEIDIHDTGTLAHIVQAVKLGDGSTRLLVEGRQRVRIKRTVYRKEYMTAVFDLIDDSPVVADSEQQKELEVILQMIRKDFIAYAELTRKIPPETIHSLKRTQDPHLVCNMIANSIGLKTERKYELLSVIPAKERLEALAMVLSQEIELLGLQKKISQKVRARMEKTQKDYFLQEQIKEINRELGRESEDNEYTELFLRLEAKKPPQEILDKAKKELARLSKLQALSPEAGVIRAYCEWLADLPWEPKPLEHHELKAARDILNEDHYGMKKAKERIVEYIAVRQLNEQLKGPILCLVGPPGTGKTSLGRSIARALDRDFVRVSLGGVRDEAEIRGHRKTYVGALPGKILQSMRKAGSANPVFLLDEIDKMSSDFRGDPASALLEVLDPEQNSTFVDHYLEMPYDLSGVVFVTTANSVHTIPYPLLDRMEIIEIPGYSEFEKLAIAKEFIIPRQIRENGLEKADLRIRDDAVLEIIRHYTMESGVRSLEREIARVIRKTAEAAVESGINSADESISSYKKILSTSSVARLLGKRRHQSDLLFAEPVAGLACGLAWTELGGTVLPVEVSCFEGDDGLILTGNLGDVMKESARTALSFLRSHAADYGLVQKDFAGRSLHIHVPEGAIPKDGPSAGVTLAAAVLSGLSGKAIEAGWAMTGEISLTGKVLAVGGIKEKLLAAHRNKLYKLVLPEANRKDFDDVPPEVARDLNCHFCSTITQVLELLLPECTAAKVKTGKTGKTAAAKQLSVKQSVEKQSSGKNSGRTGSGKQAPLGKKPVGSKPTGKSPRPQDTSAVPYVRT